MDAEARFQEMFLATYPVVARYGRHRGLSGQDLEDLVSATYEVAWRRLEVVPVGQRTLPWLLAVARNHLRNHRRRLIRDRGLLERLPAPEHTPAASEPGAVGWRDIRGALERLSAEDRELLLLIAWDGLTPAQAAGVVGLTPGAVRTRLHRARTRLARALDLAGGAEPPWSLGQAEVETTSIRRSRP
jgi:RNA polymerase sigma factor (sigma-70 family)